MRQLFMQGALPIYMAEIIPITIKIITVKFVNGKVDKTKLFSDLQIIGRDSTIKATPIAGPLPIMVRGTTPFIEVIITIGPL